MQHPGLDQTEAGSGNLNLGVPHGWQGPGRAITVGSQGLLNRKLEQREELGLELGTPV